MSLYKPKGKPNWHYDFKRNGRRFHGSTGTPDKEEAKLIEARCRTEALLGTPAAKPRMTLDQAAGRYFSEVAEGQPSEKTTEYQLANLIRLLGKDTPLGAIGDAETAGYVARRRGERHSKFKDRRKAPLVSTASVNREVQRLRAVLNRARDVWGVEIARVKWKHHLRREPARERVLSQGEEARLIEAAADHLKAPIRFALLTGLRLGNAVNLNWRQIDLQGREMRFLVKGDKPLVLPITDAVLELLAGLDPAPMGPVFTYKGRAITSWRTAWEGAKRRADVGDFHWHDMRHTAGSRMVARGVDISVVQEVMGHADIATTRRYIHVKQDAKRAALETLESRHTPDRLAETPFNALKVNRI